MAGRILVAGIGNIFLGDDAFGVEVAKVLSERAQPEGVRVVDYGIRSYDLAYAMMEEWELIILVDALPRGGEAGTLYTLEPELPASDQAPIDFDLHSMNPVGVLQLVSTLGGRTGRLLVVGCEPATLEPSAEGKIGLSAAVAAAVPEAARIVEQLIVRNEAPVT